MATRTETEMSCRLGMSGHLGMIGGCILMVNDLDPDMVMILSETVTRTDERGHLGMIDGCILMANDLDPDMVMILSEMVTRTDERGHLGMIDGCILMANDPGIMMIQSETVTSTDKSGHPGMIDDCILMTNNCNPDTVVKYYFEEEIATSTENLSEKVDNHLVMGMHAIITDIIP